jgi:hypothetical protein
MVDKLDQSHLQSFWYFASKVNFAIIGTFGVLLWATSDSPAEADFYKSQLAEYRWTLRVSSKAAEFMKFTVGMLDTSAVFLKEKDSKTTTPVVVQPAQEVQRTEPEVPQKFGVDQTMQDFGHNYLPVSEVSPSVGNSTENAYSYEGDFSGMNMGPDTRPSWSTFADTVNFTAGDVQDWSLDRLYNFENMGVVEDMLGNRRGIEEYDETNNFAGF